MRAVSKYPLYYIFVNINDDDDDDFNVVVIVWLCLKVLLLLFMLFSNLLNSRENKLINSSFYSLIWLAKWFCWHECLPIRRYLFELVWMLFLLCEMKKFSNEKKNCFWSLKLYKCQSNSQCVCVCVCVWYSFHWYVIINTFMVAMILLLLLFFVLWEKFDRKLFFHLQLGNQMNNFDWGIFQFFFTR